MQLPTAGAAATMEAPCPVVVPRRGVQLALARHHSQHIKIAPLIKAQFGCTTSQCI
jgi:hypothetical protein